MEENQNLALTPKEILEAFKGTTEKTHNALKAASAHRKELVPFFLDAIETYLALPHDKRMEAETDIMFYGFHLLGEWREKSAYRTMAKLLHMPGDESWRNMGDSATETAHRVMASVFDGDPQPIFDIILDDKACEYIRSRMFDALTILVRENLYSRDDLKAFLQKSFHFLQPRQDSFVWAGWVDAVSMAGFEDMTPLVKQIFDEGVIETGCMRFEDFEKDLQYGLQHPYRDLYEREDEFAFWENTADELSSWWGYSEEAHNDDGNEDGQNDAPEDYFLPVFPSINPYRHVGRNNPCPCGSGKKFKKCCGK